MTTSHRSSISPKVSASITSSYSDGLYDGIEMVSDEEEEELQGEHNHEHEHEQESPDSQEHGSRRSYSLSVKVSIFEN